MEKIIRLVIALSLVCILVNTAFGQINLKANQIRFRESTNYTRASYHHGDLKVISNSDYYSNDSESWGWLYCNKIISMGASQTNTFDGNLQVSGTKNFIHPHPNDTNKVIVYTCVEAGEVLTLARGVVSTVNGRAVLNLPEHFSLVTSEKGLISVIATPENSPAMLYTVSKSKEVVEIAMRDEDYYKYGDVSFSYQITGVRDNFEDQVPIQDVNDDKVISEDRKAYNEKSTKALKKRLKLEEDKKIKKAEELNKKNNDQ